MLKPTFLRMSLNFEMNSLFRPSDFGRLSALGFWLADFTRWLRRAVLGLLLLAPNGLLAQLPVNVTLDPQHPGGVIPADFLGLSFEMQRVLPETNGGHYFSADNQPLIAMFKTLGIRSLRVGGNTADRPTLPVPDRADVDALFAFARAADVKVIYTLRLNRGDPGAAADMANYISRHYAGQLDCFAIGNEPNVFSTNFESYLTEWKRFAAQITAPSNSPAARFSGPGVSPGHEKWSAQFAADLAAGGLVKYISQHDYAGGDARKVTNAAAAREKILSPAMTAHYAKFANNFMPVVRSNGLACRFEEANSFYDGGAADVSDTFAAALWALNYQWWWAEHGLSGINFHTGDKVAARDENKPCRYATFWTVPGGCHLHPIGYAEKMFSLGSRGRLLPAEVAPPPDANGTLSAHAVLGEDGNYYVTLINFTHGANATNCAVHIRAAAISGWQEVRLMRLTAPAGDIASQSGVTLGGAAITDEAQWAGRWAEVSPADAVELPAASAVVVSLKP